MANVCDIKPGLSNTFPTTPKASSILCRYLQKTPIFDRDRTLMEISPSLTPKVDHRSSLLLSVERVSNIHSGWSPISTTPSLPSLVSETTPSSSLSSMMQDASWMVESTGRLEKLDLLESSTDEATIELLDVLPSVSKRAINFQDFRDEHENYLLTEIQTTSREESDNEDEEYPSKELV